MDFDELYQELLMEHFKHPRCQGCVTDASARMELKNPLCGDTVHLTIKAEGERISQILFTGVGCSISQASASIMADLCTGKPVAEIKNLSALFRRMMKEGLQPSELDQLGDGAALAGVRKFSARIRCALLGWEALERCIDAASHEVACGEPQKKE